MAALASASLSLQSVVGALYLYNIRNLWRARARNIYITFIIKELKFSSKAMYLTGNQLYTSAYSGVYVVVRNTSRAGAGRLYTLDQPSNM